MIAWIIPEMGRPRDAAQWIALALAIAVIVAAKRIASVDRLRPRFVVLLAIVAALLSAAYVSAYLRGGPRIIDATSYYLEARAMAEGHLSFPIGEPEASVMGRFLVRSEAGRAAVIFPPGYPALLALGFWIGAPLAVGPALALAIVIATWALARVVARDEPRVAMIAAVASVIAASLRYHTADTMSHGLAALLATSALAALIAATDAVNERRSRARSLAVIAGLSLGALAATRPPSALAIAIVIACALHPRSSPGVKLRDRAGIAAVVALATAPGIALLFAHQHAATGAWLSSSQRLYYALSDGPTGCFRYGFGDNVGCLGEHTDFVNHNLSHGYGAYAALATTARRLKMHWVDPLNAEPLALIVAAGMVMTWRDARARLLTLAFVAQVAAYAPFYFDGNYPAGGARFYADVIPMEHVLTGFAVARWARERPWAPAATLALALMGFAFRAGYDHAQLRDREGGRPMFEAKVLEQAGVKDGIVFAGTDHGFNLGFDPNASPAGVVVLRSRYDALERLAWEARGRPKTYRYVFSIPEGGGRAEASVVPFLFDKASPERWVIEAESLWPARAQEGGYLLPVYAPSTWASGGRWLILTPDEPRSVGYGATVGLPAPPREGMRGILRLGYEGEARGEAKLSSQGRLIARRSFSAPPRNQDLAREDVPLGELPKEPMEIAVKVLGGEGRVALDAITFE